MKILYYINSMEDKYIGEQVYTYIVIDEPYNGGYHSESDDMLRSIRLVSVTEGLHYSTNMGGNGGRKEWEGRMARKRREPTKLYNEK